MDSVLFFGYGANRQREKITQVIGKDPGTEIGAILEGYQLAYQSVDQVPQPAQDLLVKLYGNEFKAFTLKEGNGIVQGCVWTISKEDFEKIKEWEFIGVWRELVNVKVKTCTNEVLEVVTEMSPSSHPIQNYVDGLSYREFAFEEKPSYQENKFYTQQQIESIKAWLAQQK